MIAGGGPKWLFDIDALSESMKYTPVPIESESDNQERPNAESSTKTVNTVRPVNNATPTYADYPSDPLMPNLEDTEIFDDGYDDRDEGAEADYNNLEIVISVSPITSTRIHKDHPKEQIIREVNSVVQTRKIAKPNEAGLITFINKQSRTNHKDFKNYLFACFVSRMEPKKAIRLFLAYASFMDFTVYQMDVKSAFLYGTIKEDMYVSQPPGFVDLEFPDRVYKVEKTLCLHQAPRACVKSGSTLMETHKPLSTDAARTDVDVHLYRSMIGSLMYLTSSRPDIMFDVCACLRFQVQPKVSHMHAVKRIFRYLKGQPTLGLWYPKDSPLELIAYSDSDYAGPSLDRKSTPGGCRFLGSRPISWQCKKQTIMANSTIEADYIVASNCCGQVFSNMARKNVNFLGKVTSLFDSMLVQHQAPEGEGGGASVERAITTDASLEAAQASDNILKNQTTAMPNVDIPQGMDRGGRPMRQETMGGTSAQTRSERVLEQPNESPLIEGHTSGSGEGRMEHTVELTDTIPPTPYDSPLAGGCTPGSDKGMVKLEELMDLCTILSNRVTTLENELSSTKVGRIIEELDKDEDINLVSEQGEVHETAELSKDANDATLAETLLNIKRSTTKDKGKGIMLFAEELAKETARQEQENYKLEKALELKRKLDKGEEDVDKGRSQAELFQKDEKQKLDQQTEEEEDEVEAQVDSDQEVKEMELYMRMVPDEDIAIDDIPLATKPQ
uniref:Uncharacterized mitochondrial protein AtMg00810-like n=1 Tax=Tanacetum cinerariifolium TaxID=118510 RepID=A0A6L2LL65_TANCI|nr:uncharacterized mitochondrial protein AtMg00810-like [Tanacetum cinerariifolium]